MTFRARLLASLSLAFVAAPLAAQDDEGAPEEELSEEIIVTGRGLDPALSTGIYATTTLEREAIIAALRDCNGIVAGDRGAAARLGMKRTTLLSKMKRLGISAKAPQTLN